MAYAPRYPEAQDSRSTLPTISRLAHPNDNRYNFRPSEPNYRYVPTADVYVDPTRRPEHGNARTCVMEINISVGLGDRDRPPLITSSSSSNYGKPPTIRSTARLENVNYIDLNFRTPEHVAYLATDGIIKGSSPSAANGH